jgi:hypothetical protein
LLRVKLDTVWELVLYFTHYFSVPRAKLRPVASDLFPLLPSSLLGESPELAASQF